MDGVKIGETKLGKTLLRMWFPFVVFSIFMILLIGKDELYRSFFGKFLWGGQGYFRVRFTNWCLVVWCISCSKVCDCFCLGWRDCGYFRKARTTRLPKDFTGMLFFGIAIMGVLATVFDKSITGIWATSGSIRGCFGYCSKKCNP